MDINRIRIAFRNGTLKVQSVSPTGQVEWKPVQAVHRAEIGPETVWEAQTEKGPMVTTGGHRVFLSPTTKVEMDGLMPGGEVLGVESGRTSSPKLLSHRRIGSRRFMYDLTAADWHNFALHRSGVVVSNCPDRNYHFRPPASQDAMSKQTRVFGYIWTDDELSEALQRGLDSTNLYAPQTSFTIGTLPNNWRTMVITGAAIFALQALTLNWISEEFDYSIGGVSLSIDKSSKYQGMMDSLQSRFDKMLEDGHATIKISKGLQQSRMGSGVRSAFGPALSAGVLSPRQFMRF